MTSIVMVPIHLDALLLEQDQVVAEAMADFHRLPYSNRVQDINIDVANISEDIVSSPFEDQNLFLKAGIHLHWALPDALTTGKHTPEGTNFPAVPDRWLIIRSKREAGKPEVVEQTWIVESNYLYPDGAGDLTGSISIPFAADPAKGKYRPFRYQGRSMLLDAWQAQDPQAQYLEKLTAVGYGEPTFAAFYPNCHSVFGFYDGDVTQISDGLQYDVIGWYSDERQDYFATFIHDFITTQNTPAGAETLKAAVEKMLRWTVTLPEGQEFPQQMLCYARLIFKLPGGSLTPQAESDNRVTIAIGNTGTEALSAYLSYNINNQQKATIEDQLEALQLAPRLENRQLDIGAKFVEARHEKGFASLHGGYLWTIKPETDTSVSASAMQGQKQSEITLPDDMAQKLNTLNLSQQAYDQATQNIASMRRQLFADWYKYMLSAYPPDDARENYPDIDEVRYFIESRDLALLQQAMDAAGQLNYDANGMPAIDSTSTPHSLAASLLQAINDMLSALTTFNNSQQITDAKTTYTLKRIPGPRYWRPADPVVLLVGTAIKANERHRQDDLLACPLVPDATVQDLLPGKFALIISSIDESAPGASAGFTTWTQQPWNPFLLEWEVEVFPINKQGNLHPETEAYQPDFITSNYTLAENQPDLALSSASEQDTLIKAAMVYSGRSILTPYAQSHLKVLLDEYVNNPQADTTTDTYKSLKLARDMLNAPDFYSLSQALGGFHEALLMHRQTMQLGINDPLGFDDYQQFTQRVGNAVQRENKSAPRPQWDFNPIRSGMMRILRLRLVDTFGQVRDLQWSNIIPTEQMKGQESTDLIALPPRLVQPTRLNFRWLAANTDEQEMNDHPATTPICGWVLPNNLDNSLMIYDTQGKILGIINQRAQWESVPGSLNIAVDAIPNPHLRQMVQYLINQTLRNQDASFLADFISAVDTALANIEPENFAQHQDLALLIGRPVALVRASLNLELQGAPAIHEGWNNFRQDLLRTTRDSNDFPDVVFPIRLGEYQQLNDGLVGYWKEQGNEYEGDIFYAPQSDPISNTYIKTHADNPAPLQQTLAAPPLLVSMLIDPRGTVHATSGILPVKEINIPPDQYAAALKAIEVFFLSTPIVTDVGKINLPLPVEAGYQWSWASINGTTEIGKVNVEATFAAPQEIREGWLKLSEVPVPAAPPVKS